MHPLLEQNPELAQLQKLGQWRAAMEKAIPARHLSHQEIAALESQGCWADDWKHHSAAPGFDPAAFRNCGFSGRCFLAIPDELWPRLGEASSEPAPASRGQFASCLFTNAVLFFSATAIACPDLRDCVLGPGCRVTSSTIRGGAGSLPLGRDTCIQAGLESGGRSLPLLPGLHYPQAVNLAALPAAEREPLAKQLSEAARAACARLGGLVAPGAVVEQCALVENTYLGPGALLEGCARVTGSVILGGRVGAGVVLDNTIVAAGAQADSGAILEASILDKASHVEHGALVAQSFVAPNTSIGRGELRSSLAGPFVAMHHQSLLIAAYWPDGRGNMGAGSNVGSNHTSRAPDQEIWPGEGMFFGLGCNIKFPADFSHAPYTVIATAVCTLPQRMAFPFSLITQPETMPAGTGHGINRLCPGWMLSQNRYALLRADAKYRARNAAPELCPDASVFRPQILRMVVSALEKLEHASAQSVHTEKTLPGCGKNFVLEEDRQAAILTYRSCLELAWLEHRAQGFMGSAPDTSDQDFYHRLGIALGLAALPSSELAAMLVNLAESAHAGVIASRRKDGGRGARVIDDYADTHTPTASDKVVTLSAEWLEEMRGLATLLRGERSRT